MPTHDRPNGTVRDVQLRALSGKLHRRWNPEKLELSLNTNVGIDEDGGSAEVDVEVTVRGWKEDNSDESEPVLTYVGSTTLHCVPEEEERFSEGNEQAIELLKTAWPIVRTVLIEHANRLGTRTVRLPLTLDSSNVEIEEAPAEASV